MNKLEELHFNINQKFMLGEQLAVKSAEITTDISVKFADWVDNMGYRQVSNSFYKSLLDLNGKTTQELFKEFINNHYGK
jgi:hypothetical protein